MKIPLKSCSSASRQEQDQEETIDKNTDMNPSPPKETELCSSGDSSMQDQFDTAIRDMNSGNDCIDVNSPFIKNLLDDTCKEAILPEEIELETPVVSGLPINAAYQYKDKNLASINSSDQNNMNITSTNFAKQNTPKNEGIASQFIDILSRTDSSGSSVPSPRSSKLDSKINIRKRQHPSAVKKINTYHQDLTSDADAEYYESALKKQCVRKSPITLTKVDLHPTLDDVPTLHIPDHDVFTPLPPLSPPTPLTTIILPALITTTCSTSYTSFTPPSFLTGNVSLTLLKTYMPTVPQTTSNSSNATTPITSPTSITSPPVPISSHDNDFKIETFDSDSDEDSSTNKDAIDRLITSMTD